MDRLLFLHNELLNPQTYQDMHLPLTFISFGITQGKMYRHFGNNSNFITASHNQDWGNDVVYGALFICKDYDFHARILDAYHVCSLSTLLRNHQQDIHHRLNADVTTIRYKTLDDLARLKYKEGESIEATMYFGNINHPKISKRLGNNPCCRMIDGIDAENYKKLFWEVHNERKRNQTTR